MRTQLSFESDLLSLQSKIHEQILAFEQKWLCYVSIEKPTLEQLRLEHLRLILSANKSAATRPSFNVICNPEKRFEEYVMVKEEDYDDKLSFADYVNKGFPIHPFQ